MALADRDGLDALSMRQLAEELEVVPMALYKHVASKEGLLDGMVDIVVSEIESPSIDQRLEVGHATPGDLGPHGALNRHSWAIGLMEARNPVRPICETTTR